MELREVLRTTPASRLVGIPVLVGLLVALFLGMNDDRATKATGTVSLAGYLDVDATTFGSSGHVDDFLFSVESPIVGRDVATALGPDAEGDDSLSAAQEGTGTLVTVTYRAATAEDAAAGLQAGVRQALTDVASARLSGAQDRLDVATQQLDRTNARLAELEAAAGGPDVANAYRDRTTELNGLQAQLAVAAANGDDTTALAELVDQREAQRAQIATVLNEWERTRDAVASAAEARDAAEREVLAGQQLLSRIDGADPVVVTAVEPESMLATVLLPAVAAAVAALGVVVGWSMVRGRRDDDLDHDDLDHDDVDHDEVPRDDLRPDRQHDVVGPDVDRGVVVAAREETATRVPARRPRRGQVEPRQVERGQVERVEVEREMTDAELASFLDADATTGVGMDGHVRGRARRGR